VNTGPVVTGDAELGLVQRALCALAGTAGVGGHVLEEDGLLANGVTADALVELTAAGVTYPYAVETTRVDRFAAIGQIKQQLDRFDRPGLLVAPRITAETAKQCRELGVQFLDLAGNAYLHIGNLHVFVTGQKLKPDEERELLGMATRGPQRATANALRVIFALLCWPELLNANYRDIARAARVALGTIGAVFQDLEARGFIAGNPKKAERRFLDRRRLIEEWVTTYPLRLRPKLHARRFRADNPQWWQNADLTNLAAQWGGDVAADKLTQNLKPATATLYLQPDDAQRQVTHLVMTHLWRKDAKGNIEVRDAFWRPPKGKALEPTVPPLLVYADLLTTNDPRAHAVAREIYDQYLQHDPKAVT